MKFRPCIDLHNGGVVQIVGGTINEEDSSLPVTNFKSEKTSANYAELYKSDNLTGGHIISLGQGNKEVALDALKAYPNGLQYGGGVNLDNAQVFLDAGASHVIVTSFVFSNGEINYDRLKALVSLIGKDKLVLDLSCRKKNNEFWIVTDRWQKFTNVKVNKDTITELSAYCAEFLVHGVDVEGKMRGVQLELVELLGKYSPIPATYAGGVSSFNDLDDVFKAGNGKIDITIGSALDIFGGTLKYKDIIKNFK